MAGDRPQLGWQTDPPPGWQVFGTNLDYPGPLEFWGEQYSADGLPIWERRAIPRPSDNPDMARPRPGMS